MMNSRESGKSSIQTLVPCKACGKVKLTGARPQSNWTSSSTT